VYPLILLPTAICAFSSITADSYLNGNNRLDIGNGGESSISGVVTESAPWRIVLDIGREPLSRMPFDWARSGCRMPLVVPCDFVRTDDNSNLVLPQLRTVSFTGVEGAVVKPVEGGEWRLSSNCKELSFSLVMPETLSRRDVSIEGGTVLELSGRVYSQGELERLNEEYYKSREAVWSVGGELNDILDRQGAAKKWNEEKGEWEKRYPKENPVKLAVKQLRYWGAKMKENEKMSQRPDLNAISDRGCLPGVERGVYVAKEGVVRSSINGAVMGTWFAQPITGNPISYRN